MLEKLIISSTTFLWEGRVYQANRIKSGFGPARLATQAFLTEGSQEVLEEEPAKILTWWQEPAKPRAVVKDCHSCNGRAEVKGGCRVGAWPDLGSWTKCNEYILWSCHRTKRHHFCWKWRSWLQSVSSLVALDGGASCYPVMGEDENVEIGSKMPPP